ncbi:MAG: hypothetical protein HZB65_00565, partial [Candidatus Aenigmarchaeota archaeon]|nr:hypothetical protein [Candidatus Aenigmarchaeota archaeon]
IDEEIAKKIEEQIRNADDAVVLEQLKNLKKKTEDSIAMSMTEKTNALNEILGFESDIIKNINERTVLEAEALAGYDKSKSDGVYEKQETLNSVLKQAVLRSNTKPKDWQRSKYVYNAAMKTVSYDNYRDLTDNILLEEVRSDRIASDLRRGTRSADGFRNSLVDDPNGELKIFFEKLDAGVLHDAMNEAIDNAGVDRSTITSASISAEQLGRGESATVFSVDIGEQGVVIKKAFIDTIPDKDSSMTIFDIVKKAGERGIMPETLNEKPVLINEASNDYVEYLRIQDPNSQRAARIEQSSGKEYVYVQRRVDGVSMQEAWTKGLYTEEQFFKIYGRQRAEYLIEMTEKIENSDDLLNIHWDSDWNFADNIMIDKKGNPIQIDLEISDDGIIISKLGQTNAFTILWGLRSIDKMSQLGKIIPSDAAKAKEWYLDGVIERLGEKSNIKDADIAFVSRTEYATGLAPGSGDVVANYFQKKGIDPSSIELSDAEIINALFKHTASNIVE